MIMTALLKVNIKEEREGGKRERKVLSRLQAEKTMRKPEFRESRIEFQSQHAFLSSVASLGWE